ncbi:MAG: DUF2085 domain-containing protein [Candidatus Atribacteria bacterium]|nr:DUF2085 domain-containing protein [Candidatus Atribacteria bacterium]
MPNNALKRIGAASKVLVIAAALLVFVGWFLNTPPGLFGKADAIGYAVCHRIGERSFHIGSYQLPLCARCSGMYLGAVTGLVFQSLIGWKRLKIPHWSIIALLVVFVAAFGIDGSNSYLYLLKQVSPGILPNIPNLYVPNNTLRLLTGSGMGLGMAVMLFPAFNQTVWADGEDKPAIPGWKAFGLLLGIQVIFDLLVLTESPIVLYPLAIISALGVWLLLTIVYSMVWVMIMGQDNKFTKLRQLWLPLLAGLTIALIQTAAIDALRFWLTGTWGAFPLGK